MAAKKVQSFKGSSVDNPSEDPVVHSINLKAGLTYGLYDGAIVFGERADTTFRVFDKDIGLYSYTGSGGSWTQDRTGAFSFY